MANEATTPVTPAEASAVETPKPEVEAPKTPETPKPNPTLEAAKAILAGGKPAPKEDAKRDPDTGRFEALTKREKALVEEKQRLAQEKQEVEQFRSQLAGAKGDPLKALEFLGVSVEDLANYLANGGAGDSQQARALKAEIEQLKKAQEEKFSSFEQREQERLAHEQQQVLEAFASQVSDFVEQNKDTFEFTSLYQATPMVLNLIESTFEATGELLDTKTACQLVEEHLENEVAKLTATKKFSAKFQKPSEAKTEATPPASTPPRTISNQLASSTPTVNGARASFEDERMRRALAAAEAAAKAAQ